MCVRVCVLVLLSLQKRGHNFRFSGNYKHVTHVLKLVCSCVRHQTEDADATQTKPRHTGKHYNIMAQSYSS